MFLVALVYCVTLLTLTVIAAYRRLWKRFEHQRSLSLAFICGAGMMFLVAVLIHFVGPDVQDGKEKTIDKIKQERVLPENIA